MDFKNAFEKLKTEISEADTKKLVSDFAIQVTMTDEDSGGTFYISNMEGNFSVQPYDYRDNTVAVSLTKNDFSRLISGRSKADNLIKSGKMIVSGDISVLEELIAAMPKPPQKTEKSPVSGKTAKSPLGRVEGISAKSR